MIEPRRLGFALYLVVMGVALFVIGALTGQALTIQGAETKFRVARLEPLSAREFAARSVTRRLPPMDIELSFVDRREIAADCANPFAMACAVYWPTGTAPCRIYLAAGLGVVLWPSTQAATWESEDLGGDTLAHELAHCAFGNWHQPFTDAISKLRRGLAP